MWKALCDNIRHVVNTVAYHPLYNPNILPEATVLYFWYKDNNDIYVTFGYLLQSVPMLNWVSLPSMCLMESPNSQIQMQIYIT